MSEHGWTDVRVASLKAMWAEGLSASLISGALGGVSRSAVIGKVHRLKLDSRRTNVVMRPFRTKPWGKPFSKTNQPDRPPASRPVAYEPPPSVWTAIPGTEPIGLLDLGVSTCRWPIGERPFRYCGCDVSDGSAYCETHQTIACGVKPCQ